MSVVTTIILTTSNMEGSYIEKGGVDVDVYPAIDYLNERAGWEWLKPVHPYAGGNKYPQANVFMAAMNIFDMEAFKADMRAAPWYDQYSVVLMVNGEQDCGFHIEQWR